MILVLLYWLFLFLITSSAGLAVYSLLRHKPSHPSITILVGCIGITIFASIWSIFSGLSIVFECSLILLLAFATWFNRKEFLLFTKEIRSKIKVFPLVFKVLGIAIIIMAAAKCAAAPYLIDNESYYIQSIKWLDNFGFVKGLGNLHLFFNQNSGWHILQSAVNLDFVFKHFNDLSGFILIIANFYAFDQLSQFYKSKNNVYLIGGLFPIFNILLFQFISAPSPDIPVYICFLIVVAATFKRIKNIVSTPIEVLFLISLFAIYIKVISLPLLLFPLYLWYREKSYTKLTLLKTASISVLFLLLFVIKNSIISGYLLYPLDLFSSYQPDWKVPKILQEYIIRSTNNYAYFLTDAEISTLTSWELFLHWLNLPKLHGLFNKLCVILLLVLPVLIIRKKNKKGIVVFYIAFIVQLIALFYSSPQYRFFLMFIIVGLSLIFAELIQHKKMIMTMITLATSVIAIPLFLPIDMNKLTSNKFHLELDRFKVKNIIIPHKKTQYTLTKYTSKKIKNLTFFTPENIDFFWGIGDGPLPSVQEVQIQFFKDNYQVLPQQRTKYIGDGFYSQLIQKDE